MAERDDKHSDWPDARLNALAEQVQEFRRESGDQHRALETRINKVADCVRAEAREARAGVRTVVLSAAVPVFLALLGVLYQLSFHT